MGLWSVSVCVGGTVRGVTRMNYDMEELIPIVGKLAEKYTSGENTSIPYEKAEQLMGAVLYCIREAEQWNENALLSAGGMGAQKAYEIGRSYVVEKTKKALQLYNEILPEFSHYENICLYDTFVKGLPRFFQRYDVRFEPQNTILTLDYPVLKDLSEYEGIDRIYDYILCIGLEQQFLHLFPSAYVNAILLKYNRLYKEMTDNLCEIVLMSVIGRILARIPLTAFPLEEKDYLHIQQALHADPEDIHTQLRNALDALTAPLEENGCRLCNYLFDTADQIVVRLKNAADNETLSQIL